MQNISYDISLVVLQILGVTDILMNQGRTHRDVESCCNLAFVWCDLYKCFLTWFNLPPKRHCEEPLGSLHNPTTFMSEPGLNVNHSLTWSSKMRSWMLESRFIRHIIKHSILCQQGNAALSRSLHLTVIWTRGVQCALEPKKPVMTLDTLTTVRTG